jgi:subtilisin family serine protease
MKKLTLALIINSVLATGAYASDYVSPVVQAQNTSVKAFKIANTESYRVILKATDDVSFENNENINILEEIYNNTGVILKFEGKMKMGYEKFIVSSSIEMDVLKEILENTGYFKTVDFDGIVKIPKKQGYYNGESEVKSATNDPQFGQQFYMLPPKSATNPTGFAGVSDIENAMNITGIVSKPRIAVLDTGAIQHVDVAISEGYKFSDTYVGRGSSYLDYNEMPDPNDGSITLTCEDGHGTAVANMLSGYIDNNEGISGIVESEIVMVKVLDTNCVPNATTGQLDSTGSLSNISEAILWSSGESFTGIPNITSPVDVINMSLGGLTYIGCPSYLQEAIDIAVDKGIIVTVSAGNENADTLAYAPAGCDNIISVASNDLNSNKSLFSNFGNKVDISALGENIPAADAATSPTSYTNHSGTSFSIVVVSGVAGLAKEKYPEIKQDLFEEIIKETSTPFDNTVVALDQDCKNDRCGAGVINGYSTMLKLDKKMGYPVSSTNLFSGFATCQETLLMDAMIPYVNICNSYSLNIENLDEDAGTYYVLYSKLKTEQTWDTRTEVARSTTNSSDRSFVISDVSEQLSYGVTLCDTTRCYPEKEVAIDVSTKPQICN